MTVKQNSRIDLLELKLVLNKRVEDLFNGEIKGINQSVKITDGIELEYYQGIQKLSQYKPWDFIFKIKIDPKKLKQLTLKLSQDTASATIATLIASFIVQNFNNNTVNNYIYINKLEIKLDEKNIEAIIEPEIKRCLEDNK